MKAFAEQICPCGCLVIRTGPDTDRAPKAYDYMVAVDPGGVLKGLTRNPERDDVGTFTRRHWSAVIDVIKRLSRTWRYDRFNHDNERKFGQMFDVTVSITVKEPGKKDRVTQSNWPELDYANMQLVQGTVIRSLLALGDAKAAAAAEKK